MKKKNPDNRSDQEKRSYIMSHIRGKNTSIEVLLRKRLWHLGIRYRVNYKKIPGCPDIAIVRFKIAIFCDGEFWHGKNWDEKKAKLKNNAEYWITKIERNIERDNFQNTQLKDLGWTVIRFWGDDIKRNIDGCVLTILEAVQQVIDKNQENRKYVPYNYDFQKQRILRIAEDVNETYGRSDNNT